jgi:uncharacterized membrane protein SpoIIM required for sporulation
MQIHVAGRHGRSLRLWIPLFLLWILLLPFALILLPALFIVCAAADIDPLAAMSTCMSLLAGLSGTHIEVDAPDAFLFFHIL